MESKVRETKLSDKKELLESLDREIEFIKSTFGRSPYIFKKGYIKPDKENYGPLVLIFPVKNQTNSVKRLYSDFLDRKQETKVRVRISPGMVLDGIMDVTDEDDGEARFVVYIDTNEELNWLQQPFLEEVEVEIDLSFILEAAKDFISLFEHQPPLLLELESFSGYSNPTNQNIVTPLKNLLQSQEYALRCSISNPISLIWGPAGTGKTTTLIEIVRNLYHGNKKVLITSHTNTAIDNLLYGLYDTQKKEWLIPREHIVRVGRPKTWDREGYNRISEITAYGHRISELNKLDSEIQKYTEQYILLLKEELCKTEDVIKTLEKETSSLEEITIKYNSIKSELDSFKNMFFLARLIHRKRISELKPQLKKYETIKEDLTSKHIRLSHEKVKLLKLKEELKP